MALDSAAVDAAVDAYLEITLATARDTQPGYTDAVEQDWRTKYAETWKRRQRDLFRAIFDAIVAHGEVTVTPDGTPAMAAGGDPVTGKGKGVIS